jgi:hypothetical protein
VPDAAVEAETDDMDRDALPLDRNLDAGDETHAQPLRRRLRLDQAAEIVVIGQRPEVDTIFRRPPRHHLRRQQAVGNDGMAMEIEIGWSHGWTVENKRRV